MSLEPNLVSEELPRGGRRKRWPFYVGSILVILLLTAIAIPNFVKAKTTKCKNACIANLKQLEGAIEQWALENKRQPGDPVDPEAITNYLKGGKVPSCPLESDPYILGNWGELPKCSSGLDYHSIEE